MFIAKARKANYIEAKACHSINLSFFMLKAIEKLVDSHQAAIKAPDSFQIKYKLFWACHQSLVKLAECKRIQLVRVPGHMGTDEDEVAD
jgi:hypothetical protein